MRIIVQLTANRHRVDRGDDGSVWERSVAGS